MIYPLSTRLPATVIWRQTIIFTEIQDAWELYGNMI